VWWAALTAASVLASAVVCAQELNPARRHPNAAADLGDTPQVLVRFKPGAVDKGRAQALSASAATDQVASLAARSGVAVRQARRLTAALQVLEIEPSGETLAARLARMRTDPSVEYAEPDYRRYPHALPNDPLYGGQWYLQSRTDAPAAIDAEHAWDISKGAAGVVIAVLDTGVLFNHPDLKRAAAGGRLLPGYDFVASASTANDGDGRDPNPTDPGDWVTQAEANSGSFAGCDVTNSSWHGTRVSGIIAARTNDAEGVSGVTWNPWILPVRVLGKCGGRDSDILAAMLWAAGIRVDGVPDNLYPAKVENLSLGSSGGLGCPRSYQDVIAEVSARGTLVVVSAGNEGGPVDVPANCAGAAAIAGLRHAGTKVGYSSLGPEVALSAPAGNCVNTGIEQPCLFSIDTTYNLGQTSAGAFDYTNQINANFGTSFSAPIVSGIAGLMASVNGNLSAAQLIARLREGATKPFPPPDPAVVPAIPQCHVPTGSNDLQNTECGCTTSVCGAGMANAPGAVAAALRPIAAVAVPAAVSEGQTVTLSAEGSAAACGRTIASYAWSATPGGVSNPNGPSTAVVAPPSGKVTVHLVVTDDAGNTDTADISVTSTSATTTAPGNSGHTACLADFAAPPPVSVAVSPAAVSLPAGGGTQSFVASVSNALDTSVIWRVDGSVGGNATVGTISALGTYTAPTAVPSPDTVTITAVSNEDGTALGAAQVTLTAAVQEPAAGGGGGGGGGAGLDLLLAAAALLGLRRALRFSAQRGVSRVTAPTA
jgi:serine protease